MLRWWGTLLWVVANVLIGICAILPLGLGLSLIAYPAATVLGRPAPFELDGGRSGSAAGVVLLTLLVLAGLFALVNVPFRRRLPAPASHVVWPAATVLVLAPFVVSLWS